MGYCVLLLLLLQLGSRERLLTAGEWEMAHSKLSDRQAWLLIYLLTRYPRGVSENGKVPHSCDWLGKNYGNPGGIGMGNLRGLEKRGYVKEQREGLFYLTENGVLAAEAAAVDTRWA